VNRSRIDDLILHYNLLERDGEEHTWFEIGSERTIAILEKCGFAWRDISQAQIESMLEHCKAVGFIK
jgi:hypothetical protein